MRIKQLKIYLCESASHEMCLSADGIIKLFISAFKTIQIMHSEKHNVIIIVGIHIE